MGAIVNMSTKLRSVTPEVGKLTECIWALTQTHPTFVWRRKELQKRSFLS